MNMSKKKNQRLQKHKNNRLVKSLTFSSTVYGLSVEIETMSKKFSLGVKYMSKVTWIIQVAILNESLVLWLGISALIFAQRKTLRKHTGIDIRHSFFRCLLCYIIKKVVPVLFGIE